MDDLGSISRRLARAPAHRRAVQITERDRELLGFVSQHRLVLADHVQVLLGISAAAAYARLRALADAGFLRQQTPFHRRAGCYQITRQGLAVIGSELPPPRIDLRCYDHDGGVAWVWLAARAGMFGPLQEILAERRLRSRDATQEGRSEPLGVRLGGLGPGGRERLHYPDLLLLDRAERRIALELELSPKGRTRREKILAGYGADSRVDAVLYLVERQSIARSIRACARGLGVSHLVHVLPVRLGAWAGPSDSRGVAQRECGSPVAKRAEALR